MVLMEKERKERNRLAGGRKQLDFPRIVQKWESMPMSTAVAFGLLIVAIAIIIYTMIKNILISVVIGAVGEIALVIVYVVKSSIFQGGIQKVLNVFNLSGHYDNFTNGVFDVTGIVYFISVIAICLFLTMQSIQKRRWN